MYLYFIDYFRMVCIDYVIRFTFFFEKVSRKIIFLFKDIISDDIFMSDNIKC